MDGLEITGIIMNSDCEATHDAIKNVPQIAEHATLMPAIKHRHEMF